MKKNIKRTAIFLSAIFCAGITFAQEALKSIEEEYYNFLSLQGITKRQTLGYRTLSDNTFNFIEEIDEDTLDGDDVVIITPSHPWQNNNLGKVHTLWKSQNSSTNLYMRGVKQGFFLKIYGPEWFNSFNTAVPYGQNDGALWQGKGYNTSLTGGARIEGYGFEVTLKPQVTFSQNLEFEYLTGVYGDPHSYFWKGNIDLPQRFGDSPYWQFDWGDTEIRYTWHTLTVGFGTQSPWLGPAWLNSMLGSNNAGTYPKLDIGLRRQRIVIPKLGWYLGDIEGRIWCGQLTESKYFDNEPSNDKRMINGTSLSYSPPLWDGLSIGVNRIFLTKWKMENLKYIGRLFTLSQANDITGEGEDQKAALFICQEIPQVGFEVYGELGIDDFTSEPIANPFHTAIYTVGAKKTLDFLNKIESARKNNIRGEFIFEWNNFEMSQDFQLQWTYMGYYQHWQISQGYTQNGQIIGAGTGYFGNSQFLGLKIFYPKGSSMFYLHRSCPDNNYIYSKAVNENASYDASLKGENTIWKKFYGTFKTYICIGINTDFFVTNSFLLSGTIEYIDITYPRYNRDERKLNNFRFCINLKYEF